LIALLAANLPHAAAAEAKPLATQYCGGCHSQKAKMAGIVLEGLDPSHPEDHAAVWEKVLRKLKAGQMPPAGLPRPSEPVLAAFTTSLGAELDRAAAANPNPGNPTIHRLNRAEYSNAVRDLLALDIKPGAKLPADDIGYGFDNIGDVLSLSPILIERYMSVARMVSRLAVGEAHIKPEVNEFQPPRTVNNPAALKGRVSDDLPFDSLGGMSFDYDFPVDGEYSFKIKLPLSAFGEGTPPESNAFEVRVPVKAGVRTVGATFMAENAAPEIAVLPGRRGPAAPAPPPTMAKMDLRLDGARVKLFEVPQAADGPRFVSIAVGGPYEVKGVGDTPSRRKIFVCTPTSAKDEDPCARKILSNLGRYAYRRPLTDADLKPLLGFYQTGRREGSFEKGIQMALRAMLVSPAFLFRIERDPGNVPAGTAHRISDFELASRLSFFLWSSIPDEELLNLAGQGKLKEPAILSAQVTRMLDDPKSKAFVSNFAGQWLYLRNLSQVTPDQDAFPNFDPTLRQAFQTETEMFFNAVMRENRPVTDLLSADFTYLNQRLAKHYGISGVYGSQFRRVTLKDSNRSGLLGQGSILTVTSYPDRTSVVQRGKWVLENLLGTAPPPPPPDIPALEAKAKDGKRLTMRQQMEQHRANPTCASCHSRMDPIGFSLENYDGVGAWRSKDHGNPIDASGKMPDGTVFDGPAGLRKLLLSDHREEFLATVTEKLLTFALGRGLEYYDAPAMRAIVRDAETQNSTIPALISSVVKSPQFQMRRTREP
ncbi:MAG: DUF1592 domain-containing protein, partial [Bryobacteraceae bacterium]